ncbi:MAG: flagellar basal-body MS-ring/collar protein FliF [Clostridia bacterium]|nr:flagellar basal-body MS-ring/collar protein FliF [Clostridia bacterium]
MEKKLKDTFSQLVGSWKSVTHRKKITIISLIVGIAVVITLIVTILNTVSYSLLYSGLDSAEAGTIVDQITAMNVAVRVQGTSIYVDSKQADAVKMKLAEAGYPQSTLSYDIFMKGTSWAMTDSDKQKLALYQVQDRLQDTIKTIPGVNSAEVTIGQQDNNSYVLSTDSTPVTASVKLNLVTGASLTSQQVRGIVLLVAKSVPDLSEDNVSVLDSDGTPLTDTSDGTSGTSSTRIELQSKIENMVSQKVVTLLNPIFGQGNVRAAAGVTIDFSQTVTNKTTYSPDSSGQGVAQSVSRTIQSNSTAGTSSTSGQTTYVGGTSSQSSSGGTTTNEQTSYLVDTMNQQIQDEGGSISKLTVAVILNEKSPAATESATTLKQTIAYAVGIDPSNVNIQLAAFSTTSSSASSGVKPSTGLPAQTALIAGGAALPTLALIILIVIMASHSRRAKKTSYAIPTRLPAAAPVRTVATAVPSRAAINEAAATSSIEDIFSNSGASEARKQIDSLADSHPELVAQLIKGWLKD